MAHELLHALKYKKGLGRELCGNQNDIRKAYDRVEWSFLEQVMKHVGFDEKWIHRVMTRVTTVIYSTLINGSAYGNIKPSRGI